MNNLNDAAHATNAPRKEVAKQASGWIRGAPTVFRLIACLATKL